MRMHSLFLGIVVVGFACCGHANAALLNELHALYNFETDLANQSGPGGDLTVLAGGSIAGWSGGIVSRGPPDGTSTRTTLLVGNAGNYVDIDNDRTRMPFGTATLGDSFAISAWYYLAPNTLNGSSRFFVFEGSNNFDVSYGISSGDTYASYVGQNFVEDTVTSRNAWHHVLHNFSSDGTNTTLDVYIDGVLEGSDSELTSLVNFPAINLGLARSTTGDRDWDGLIDEVGVWSLALTVDEIALVRARGLAGQSFLIPEPSSVLLWGIGCLLLACRAGCRRLRYVS